MKNRDHKQKNFKQTRNIRDWELFKELRNMVKRKLREAESNYYNTQIYNNKRSVRTMWKAIRQCLPFKDYTRPPCRDPNLLALNF